MTAADWPRERREALLARTADPKCFICHGEGLQADGEMPCPCVFEHATYEEIHACARAGWAEADRQTARADAAEAEVERLRACTGGSVDGLPWAEARTALIEQAHGNHPSAASDLDAVSLALSNAHHLGEERNAALNLNTQQALQIVTLRDEVEQLRAAAKHAFFDGFAAGMDADRDEPCEPQARAAWEDEKDARWGWL